MKNKSLWINNKINNSEMSKLNKDIECDVLIIGGGMAGLSTAYNLMNFCKKVVLIDKDKCGMGATCKNTGKLTWMQGLVYSKLSKNYNDEVAKLYFDSQIDAINSIKKIIDNNDINCHLRKTKSYVFSYTGNDYIDFSDEIKFYDKYNIKYKLLDRLPINYDCYYALETYDSYVFNPYEYLVGLKNIIKNKIDIYENTRCISVDKDLNNYVVLVDNGYKIRSKFVVVASHYPMFIVPFLTPLKTRVDRFFLSATKCDAVKNKIDNKNKVLKNNNVNSNNNYDVQIISNGKRTVSMRYYNDDKDLYLIYGRRNHSITSNLDVRNDYNELNNEYNKHFGNNIEYFYHTHDLMTYDSLPFIGRIDNNLFICTGFNKWGNTNGTIAGIVISDLIKGKENRYACLFNPKRGLSFDKVKNLFLYNIEVGSRYVINKICSNKGYYGDDVKIEYIDGKKCGIYIDESGNKHIVSNICPHMKCNLIFNYIDKTWDCPCHTSRFDIDGNIIYGPSVFNIGIKND